MPRKPTTLTDAQSLVHDAKQVAFTTGKPVIFMMHAAGSNTMSVSCDGVEHDASNMRDGLDAVVDGLATRAATQARAARKDADRLDKIAALTITGKGNTDD
jgi:hypothetical protein